MTHIYRFLKNRNILSESHDRLSKKRLGKHYERILDIIYRLTSFVSESSTLGYRIKLLKFGIITESSLKCPVCESNIKERRNGRGFSLTCGSKDEEHFDYIRVEQVRRSKEKQYTLVSKQSANNSRADTMLSRHGVKYPMQHKLFRQKFKDNLISKYGVDNPSKIKGSTQKAKNTSISKYGHPHYNQKGYLPIYNLLTSSFIKTKFITKEGYFLSREFQKIIGCKKTASFDIIRSFNIDFLPKNGCFSLDKPARLYYIYDQQEELYKIGITNRTLDERFGKSFLENRHVKILQEIDYNNGLDAWEAEQEILKAFAHERTTNDSWPQKLGGKTEFFNKDILNLHNI